MGGYDRADFGHVAVLDMLPARSRHQFVPQPVPAMGDLTAGAALAGAIAAALLRRERTGKGAVVDVSLLSTAMWVGAPAVMASLLYGVDTIPRMRHADLPNPLVAAYAPAMVDLLYLAGIQTENHFENFCACVDRKDLLTDPRFVTGAERPRSTAPS